MKKILAAVDASAISKAVVREAIAEARAFSGKVRLLRAVWLPVEVPMQAFAGQQEELLPLLVKNGEKELAALSADIPPELLDGVAVEIGTPWHAICDAAKAYGADLIVIGAHGHSLIERMLGSTATKVINHAACATLVIKA